MNKIHQSADLFKVHSAYSKPLRIKTTYYGIGESQVSSESRVYNDQDLSVTLSGSNVEDFKCWVISGEQYFPGDVFYDKTSVDINAMMSCHGAYRFSYDSNGGYGNMPDETCEYDRYISSFAGYPLPISNYYTLKLPECKFSSTFDKSCFKAWRINDSEYAPSSYVTVSSDTKAFAVWVLPSKFTVGVNNQSYGNVSGDTSGTYPYGTEINLSANPFDGHVFSRWSDGKTNSVYSTVLCSDLDLTAFFEYYGPVIYFYHDGTLMEKRMVRKMTSVGKLPEFSSYDMYFIGWYCADKNIWLTPGYVPTGNITVQAKTAVKQVKLTKYNNAQIVNGIASDFYENNGYLLGQDKTNIVFSNNCEIKLKINTGDTVPFEQAFLGINTKQFQFGCKNGSFVWNFNGVVKIGRHAISANTWYLISIKREDSQIECRFSVDGTTYMTDATYVVTDYIEGQAIFGNSIEHDKPWYGSIDLSQSKVTLNGKDEITFDGTPAYNVNVYTKAGGMQSQEVFENGDATLPSDRTTNYALSVWVDSYKNIENHTDIIEPGYNQNGFLQNFITYANNVYILKDAFNNSNVTSVDFKNTEYSYIGENAFVNCKLLKKMPDVVINYVGDSAFRRSSLESLDLDLRGKYYTQPSDYEGCVATNENGPHVGSYAFADCKKLKSVNLKTSTELAAHMFDGCSELTSVTMANHGACVGEYAFANCSKLESITLPQNFEIIGQHMFDGCANLKSVNFAGKMAKFAAIEDYAFNGCASLTSIVIPAAIADVDSIDDNAFENSGIRFIRALGINSEELINYTGYTQNTYTPFNIDESTMNDFKLGQWYGWNNGAVTAAAIKFAQTKNVPLVFIWCNSGCSLCAKLKQNVLKNKECQEWVLNSKYLFIYYNYSDGVKSNLDFARSLFPAQRVGFPAFAIYQKSKGCLAKKCRGVDKNNFKETFCNWVDSYIKDWTNPDKIPASGAIEIAKTRVFNGWGLTKDCEIITSDNVKFKWNAAKRELTCDNYSNA